MPGRAAAKLRVAYGTIRDTLIFGQRGSGSHSGRLVDVLRDIVVVTLAAYSFNDDAEQKETVVAVLPTAAGLESQPALAIKLDVVLERAEFQSVLVEFGAEEISCAARMREQMVEGHLGGDIFV